MRNLSLRSVALAVTLCFLVVGMASASAVLPIRPVSSNESLNSNSVVNVNDPFPTAGDAYCSFTIVCGNISAGGQTAFQWTAGDFVISSVFVLPTSSVTDITANWSYADFLGNGNTETWFALINGIAVAQVTLPDDGFNGDILT